MNLQREILLRQMSQPKKTPLADAERQARRRAKVKAEARTGNLSVSAMTFDAALLDALAIIIQERDPLGYAEGILLLASAQFKCADQAKMLIKRRLMNRKPQVMNPDTLS